MKTATTTVPGTTTAEAEVLAATAASLAAGGDPFGDNDDDEAPAAGAAADADDDEPAAGTAASAADEEGTEAAAEDLSPEALAAVAGDDEAPAPAAPRYTTDDLAGLAAQRAELTTTKAKALKDLMDGVIEPEEYSRIEGEVSDKLDALTVQRTLHEANVQTEAQQQASVLDTIMRAAKKAGEVDYTTDAKAAKQFDTAMKMLGDDGEKRSYAELAADAHKMVLAARGVAKVESVTTLTPAKARENGKGPMTLRNVPAAAVAQTGGGWIEQLNSLSGQEYEAAFSKLTPAQRAQLLND